MPTTTKKIVPVPALRTARQRPARMEPFGASRLQWYLCSAAGAFSHLVLLDGHGLFAHWVLPALPAEAPAAAMLTGLWTQVPPALALAVPEVGQAVRRGTCQLVGNAATTSNTLEAGQLLLHLPVANSNELYALRQLRPGGPGWLLRKAGDPDQPFTKQII